MALTSVYYDGPVTETDRAKNLAGAPEYGVYGPEDFKVTAHPSIPYAVLVKAGKAHGHGVTDTAAEDQVVQCATISTGTRWDLIVVRRNWQPALGGPSTLAALQAGATAAIPATRKVGPGVEDDQPLFLIKWQGGISAPVDFIDLRVWAGNGGLYAKSDLVRTYLTSPGTQVNIDGVDWLLRIGDNNIPEWASFDWANPPRGYLGVVTNAAQTVTGTGQNALVAKTFTLQPNRRIKVTAKVTGKPDTAGLAAEYQIFAGGVGLEPFAKSYAVKDVGESFEFSAAWGSGGGGLQEFSLQCRVVYPANTAGLVKSDPFAVKLTATDEGKG